MPRSARPSDPARLRVPTDLRLSPDGQLVCFVVKESSVLRSLRRAIRDWFVHYLVRGARTLPRA